MADIQFLSREKIAGIIGKEEEAKIPDAFRGIAIEIPLEVPETLPGYLEALSPEGAAAMVAGLPGSWVCIQCRTEEYNRQAILDWVNRGEGLARTAMAFGISEWDVKRSVAGKINL